MKEAKEAEMVNDCASAAKTSNVDLGKFTCDMETLTFVPRVEDKKADEKRPEDKK